VTNSKSNFTIVCPGCESKIQVDELIRSQVTDQLTEELAEENKRERSAISELRMQLEKDRQGLEKSREEIEVEVEKRLRSQVSKLESEAIEKAKKDLSVQISDQKTEIEEVTSRLKVAQENELKLRQRERALAAEKAELELKVAREIESERTQLVAKAKEQFKAEYDLKAAEKNKTIDDMRKKIDDLKRKAELGSQQLQGEVKEEALEECLSSSFRSDVIEPIKKGVRGADACQHVFDSNGNDCGSILWESKRTKAWSSKWIEKLKDDQRSKKAAFAVLVSDVLPSGMTTFGCVEGVWVCSWECVVGLASALRAGLIELGKTSAAAEGKQDKMELVYQYLAGQEFQQRVATIVEAFVAMQKDLDSEKRSMERMWKKRGKQLDRAIFSATHLYGDLQGIIGKSLPTIPELEMPRITDQTT